MKNFNKVFLVAILSFATLACAPTPKIVVSGPNFLMFIDEIPVWQTNFSNKEACEFDANQTSQVDANVKNLLSNGKMRITCSSISLDIQLPYKASAKNSLTNERRDIRFQSKEACIFMDTFSAADPVQGKGWRYDCL